MNIKKYLQKRSRKMEVSLADGIKEIADDIMTFAYCAERAVMEISELSERANRIIKKVNEIKKIQFAIQEIEHKIEAE